MLSIMLNFYNEMWNKCRKTKIDIKDDYNKIAHKTFAFKKEFACKIFIKIIIIIHCAFQYIMHKMFANNQ